MGSAEKLCLSWNDFEANISSSFRDLRNRRDFFDISLACSDDQVVQAHKVIIAACSPFFRSVLAKQSAASPLGLIHPVIYLRGVTSHNLRHVLDFMYHGEVNVEQDDLESFLAVAQDLQIKGLTQNDNNSGGSNNDVKPKMEPGMKRPGSDPPDRGGPPMKKRPSVPSSPIARPRPPAATPPSTSSQQPPAASENDDDIQDITPQVKSEPTASTSGAVLMDPSQHLDQSGYAEGAEGAEEYGEEDYSQYASESGDMSFVDEDGQMMPGPSGAAEGTKGGLAMKAMEEEYIKNNVDETSCGTICLLCGAVIKQRSNVRRHFGNKHNLGDQSSYRCPLCPHRVYKNRHSFANHIYNVHKELKGLTLDKYAVKHEAMAAVAP